MINIMISRIFSIFWIAFMLFFAFPFPMVLYYSIRSENMPNLIESDPWFSLALVASSILLWIIVLIGYYYKWVIRNFGIKRNIERLKTTGIPREAKILEATRTTNAHVGYDTYTLNIQFKNLVDSEITHKTVVNDAKPYERRYEVGKRVSILIDPEVRRIPYFIFATTEVSIRKMIILLTSLAWLALLTAVVAYYAYAYQTESEGMGWRFMSIGHPLLICPAVLLFYRFLLALIAGKLFGRPSEKFLIKFKGIETKARLLAARQTGTYINEQPMIEFELEFRDQHYQKHQVSIRKVIDLLELDITKQEYLSVFYLKDNPRRIAFAQDLNELNGEF